MRTTNTTRSRLQLELLEVRTLLTAAPQLVGDFNLTAPRLEQQTDNAWLGDELFFAADDGTGDVELWKSDGTSEGTVRVKDIREGAGGSMPRNIVAVDRLILFTAHTDQFGRELWATDGTEVGTVLIQDFAPGPATPPLNSFIPVGGKLYFSHNDELWITDGTATNTRFVAEASIDATASVGDDLYYTTRAENETTLWKTDGSEPKRITTLDGRPRTFHPVSGWLYFAIDEMLWKSDGTETGTSRVSRLPHTFSFSFSSHSQVVSGPGFLLEVVDTIDERNGNASLRISRFDLTDDRKETVFRVRDFSDYPEFISMGGHLYFTIDGQLRRIDAVSDETELVASFEDPQELREAGGMLYIVDLTQAGRQLWRSDGTHEGTELVDSQPGTGTSNPWLINGRDGTALFWSSSHANPGLWTSTSEHSALSLVSDAITGPTLGGGSEHVHSVGDQTYFGIDAGQGKRLWRTVGEELQPITNGPLLNHDPRFTELNGLLYFLGEQNGTSELWRTDGTDNGTSRIRIGNDSARNPTWLTQSARRLYFVVQDERGGTNVWSSDGTESGTSMVMEISADGRSQSPRLTGMTDVDGTLYYTISQSNVGELWKIGADRGPELVATFNGEVFNLTAAGDKVFFSIWEETGEDDGRRTGRSRLGVSDGTVQGTSLLAEVSVGSPVASGDKLFFLGSSEEFGEELWVSDGTEAGTHMVRDIALGRRGCGGRRAQLKLIAYDGGVYFAAEDENGVRSLYKSDGTEEGTVRLSGIYGDALARSNGNVYFTSSDEAGRELWQSDGTVEGTMRVADINPGTDGSMSKYPAASVAGGKLYFSANDGFHGSELWSLSIDPDPVLPGDADANGTVDFQDFAILSANFGKTDAVFADGDFDRNGAVGFEDFVILATNFGRTQSTTSG